MGIFNQQPNYNQSYTKEKRGITALKDLLARLDLLVLRVSQDLLALKVLLVLLALKVLLVHRALVLISHQMGITIRQAKN